jgi:hypothetical protein
MAQSIEELQALVDAWQAKEDAGGTPTSAAKLASAKEALAEAQAASKPKKKAKKAKVEEVPEVEEAEAEEEAEEGEE